MRFDDTAIQGILSARRVIGRATFPGTDPALEIGVRLVSEREIDLARFESQLYLERQAKKVQLSLIEFVQVDPESLDREHQRQVIMRSFVDPEGEIDKPVFFFDNIEQVRSLDSVMVHQLWEIYTDWQDVVNPHVRLTDVEVEELVDALGKEQYAKVVLAPLSRETLTGLVRSLAAQLRT